MAEEDDLFAMFCEAIAEEANRSQTGMAPPAVAAIATPASRTPLQAGQPPAPVYVQAPEPRAHAALKPLDPEPAVSLAAERPLSKALPRLRRCPALVKAARIGDASAVRRLLAGGADPNAIEVEEERMKGGECCAGAMITKEERTALIAACLGQQRDAIEAILLWPSTDVNVVCIGYDEDLGPYKHFTALDLAAHCGSALRVWLQERLQGLGAKPAAMLPEPLWPREQPEDVMEEHEVPEAMPEAMPEAPLPDLPPVHDEPAEVAAAARHVMEEILEALKKRRRDPRADRAKLVKQLLLEWHPDKRPQNEAELGKIVSQWINGFARRFVEN